ncbi:MAG: ketopantoate reductase family protein [Ardenticatenaceae bacterium]|nr:ketopantoate reductase family protein [Anaerolineales bacterium]MCB8922397.1 ketopantoate reductase family protein [Ardenticatenaceae bacterium]MCB8991329.1 ketopantoate reductase family protein [Ardenticatenaceae bacterium]
MKILVYGAGAVGGYLAARLSQQGHDTAVIVRDVAASIIKEHGLSVTENGRTNRTQPTAYTSIAEAFKLTKDGVNYDLIIMAMKAYDVAAAIDPLVAFCTQPPPIIAVQNGIGAEAPLIQQYGAERVIAASVTTPISRESTNSLVIEHSDRGLALAPIKKGQDINQWVSLFQDAGITTLNMPDYQAMKWSKALLNMVGNATSAILNRSPDAIYKIAPLFDLEIRMLKETLAVMKKLKLKVVDLPGASTSRLVFGVRHSPVLLLKPILTQIVSKGRGEKMPSFHIDLSSNKGQSEVIYHNGAVAKAGQKVGVPTPVNLTLTAVLLKLVRQEVDWRDYDGNAKRLLQDVRRTEKETVSKQ